MVGLRRSTTQILRSFQVRTPRGLVSCLKNMFIVLPTQYFAFELKDPQLAFVTKGARGKTARWRAGGSSYSHSWQSGRVCFVNARYELSAVSMPACRQIILQLDASTAAQLLGDQGHTAPKILQDHFVATDVQVGYLVRGMHTEICSKCPSGRIYGETLSLALLSYLLARYSRKPPEHRSHSLSRAQRFRAVVEFIEANLGSDLSLASLAEIAGTTPQHFCYAFKAAFGVSPHMYIIGERVRVAKHLLACRKLPIAEIAFAVGFSIQSHFTATFRKSMALTPLEYQRAL